MALSDGLLGKLFARRNSSEDPYPHKERRRSERHRMDLPVRFRLYVPSQPERGTLLIPAQLYDISEHGMGLLTGRMEYDGFHLTTPDRQSLEPCLMEIEIPFGREPLRVRGKVVWYVPNPGAQAMAFRAGIEFVEVTAELRDRIRSFISLYRSAAEV